jgi:hypothetical protein
VVEQLPEGLGEVLVAGGEAEVQHVQPVVDAPLQPVREDECAALQVHGQHPHADDLHLWGEGADHAGTRGAVPVEVVVRRLDEPDAVLRGGVALHRNRPVDAAHQRMPVLHTRVEHPHLHAATAPVAIRPLAGDAAWQVELWCGAQ